MRNYNSACSSLRPGQLDKLMNKLHVEGREMNESDNSASQPLNDLLCAKTSEIVQGIYVQREKILEAFIAETGLMPSECEQVVQGNKWWVQKRA